MSILSSSADKQDSVVKAAGNVAKGTVPGLMPELATKDLIEEVSGSLDDAKEAYKGFASDTAALVYARAASRDLSYAMMGRRAVMTAGLTRSANSARWRGFMLAKLQK